MDGVCEVERNSNRKNVDKEHRDGEKGIWVENSMDRGAWWATVHGVTKSQT